MRSSWLIIVELSHGVYNFKDVWAYFKRCGWRATPAGPLSYDHFYIQPGKTKHDVKGVDYFDGEAELVAYGKALKIFGDMDESAEPPRSATLSPVLPPKPRRRRSNSNSSSVVSVTPSSHAKEQTSAPRTSRRSRTARRQLPNPSDVISISSNTSEGEEDDPSFAKTSTAESESFSSSSSSSEEEFMPTLKRREEDPDVSPPRLKTKTRKRRQISDTSDSSPAQPKAQPSGKKRATPNGILGKQTAKKRVLKPQGLLFQTNNKMAMGESPPARRKPAATSVTGSQSSGRSQPSAKSSASASSSAPSQSDAPPQHFKVSTSPVAPRNAPAQRPPTAPAAAQEAPVQDDPPATIQPPKMDVQAVEPAAAPSVANIGDVDVNIDSGVEEVTCENGVEDTSYANEVDDTNCHGPLNDMHDGAEEIAGIRTHLDLKKVTFPSSPTQMYRIRITSAMENPSSAPQTTIWMENLQSREQR